MDRRVRLGAALLLAACAQPATGQTDAAGAAPLSVIPWLSETLDQPTPDPTPAPQAKPDLPGVSAPPVPHAITVTPLAAPDRAATGLMSVTRAGLPPDLWQGTDPVKLAQVLRAMPIHSQPALQEAVSRLVLVEAAPPQGARDALLLARIDALLIRGALEPAQALLERAGPDTPDLFRRWFDILLLSGTEDRACATLAAKPDLSPNYETRVFCLARGGRWHTAALTLETATALGQITQDTRDRLARFLDPDIFEGEPMPPLPDPITPLTFRLLEAVGEHVPTTHLPLAFAQTDLRHIVGWKSQIEAAERLAQSGALSVNRLLGIYTARLPAASGGVWDRVAAVQALDIAITAGQADTVAIRLPAALETMRVAGLEAVLAQLFGARLARLDLPPRSAGLAHAMALVADATPRPLADSAMAALPAPVAFATALAQGTPPTVAAPSALASALRAGLARDAVPDRYAAQIAEGRWGEALLQALVTLSAGAQTDPEDAGDAAALMAQAGMEDLARRAAVQILLLGDAG